VIAFQDLLCDADLGTEIEIYSKYLALARYFMVIFYIVFIKQKNRHGVADPQST
jgi:hypothetical protein